MIEKAGGTDLLSHWTRIAFYITYNKLQAIEEKLK
jgi:hypothetical protein